MAEQEVNIKLKADASEALKSVKDLEKSMNNIDNVKRKGDQNDGFISPEDVRNFKKNAQQAEQVYKQFLNQYDRMKQEFDRRKRQLESQMKTSTDQEQIKKIQQQIQQLESQRNNVETQRTIADNMNQRVNDSSSDVNNMRQGTNFGRLAQHLSSSIAGPLIGALSFGKLFGFAKQGMHMVSDEESYGAKLGNRWQQYNGDYTQLRKDAMNTGMSHGYTAMETMQTSDILTSMAGNFKNAQNMWSNVSQIQTVARAMGIDPNQMATSIGAISQRYTGGQMGTADQKQFANLIAGAVHESGMQGRQSELTDAITNLATQAAQTKTSISKADLAQITGLETSMGKDIPSLKGAAGAQLLGQMDQGLKSGNNNVDLLLGWGTKYQGLSGRAALDRAKAKGITDPANVKSFFTNMNKSTGGNKDLEQLMLEQDFGWSGDQASAVLHNKNLMKTLQNGGMTKDQMSKLSKMGANDISKYDSAYDNSKAGQRSRSNSQWQKTLKAGGEVLDNVWRPIKDGFTKQPSWMQWGEMGAMGAGATMYGPSLLRGLGRGAGNLFSRPVGSQGLLSRAWGGISSGASKLWGGAKNLFKGGAGDGLSGLLKGAGKFLGPIGELTAFKGIDDMDAKAWDWLSGHKKGMTKQKSMFTPWAKDEHYTDNRQGALSKAWNGVKTFFGGSEAHAAELSPAELKKQDEQRKQLEQKKLDTAKLTKENLKSEQEIATKKTLVADKDQKNNQDLKKNIDNLNNPSSGSGGGGLLGGIAGIFSSLFGMNGSGGGSGGGFFSNIMNGIKGFFGNMFGGNGNGGGGTGGDQSAPKSLSGNGNSQKVFKFLTGKGLTAQAAAGVMGNLQQESGMDPNAPGGGLAQWTGDRKKALDSYAKKNGLASNSMEAQLGYLWKEMSSGSYGNVSKLNGMNSSNAAQYFEKNFEKAGIPMMGNRVNYANSFYDQYGSTYNASASKSSSTHNVNVTVSGSVKGMTAANQALIANGIKTGVSSATPYQAMYQFSQGVGGNR